MGDLELYKPQLDETISQVADEQDVKVDELGGARLGELVLHAEEEARQPLLPGEVGDHAADRGAALGGGGGELDPPLGGCITWGGGAAPPDRCWARR